MLALNATMLRPALYKHLDYMINLARGKSVTFHSSMSSLLYSTILWTTWSAWLEKSQSLFSPPSLISLTPLWSLCQCDICSACVSVSMCVSISAVHVSVCVCVFPSLQCMCQCVYVSPSLHCMCLCQSCIWQDATSANFDYVPRIFSNAMR